MVSKTPNQGNRNKRRRRRPRIGKREGFTVEGGLRNRPQSKSIRIRNVYAALNHTELLENENSYIMVNIKLRGNKQEVIINAMIDSGAIEDFIDKDICEKYHIERTKSLTQREIHLVDGNPSTMGPATHIATIPMEIGSHRESATFKVANLQHHEAILGTSAKKQFTSGGRNPRPDGLRPTYASHAP